MVKETLNETEKTIAPTPPLAPAVPPHPAPTVTNGLAIASMVVGIVAFVTGWAPFWGILAGVAAVVLGVIALKKPSGKGMSIAGIITGGLAVLSSLIATAFFLIALVAGGVAFNEVNNQIQQESAKTDQMVNAKKDFSKGETAVFGPYEVKVNSVERNFVPDESSYYQADEGNEYVVVNLTVKDISDENKYVGPYTFSLTDAGVAVDSALVTAEPELAADNLEPGESVTGNLVFEVKKDSTKLKLQFETTVFDPAYKPQKLVYTLAL